MNIWMGTGRITHDLEIKVTPKNKHVLEFQIAIRETKDITTFLRCQAWEQTADYISEYAQKGSNLAVMGKIQTNRYQDRNNNNVEKVYVRVDRCEVLDKWKEKLTDWNQGYDVQGTKYEKQYGGFDGSDVEPDDLPFY